MKAVDERGKSSELLRKARCFADPRTGYTARELEALVKRCEGAVYPLGMSHIIRLLAVPKSGGQRKAMEEKAIKGCWSRRTLDIALRKSIGSHRTFAGRSSRRPQDSDEALVMIAQICRRWDGLMRVVMPGGKASVPLPPVVTKRLRAADAAMRKLASSVEA